MRLPFALLSSLLTFLSATAQPTPKTLIDKELPSLVTIYKDLHAAPELSHHEEKTSAFLAEQLRSAGFEVTEHVGKYRDSILKGYGVVAVMKNGPGPTVMVRSDMDALPVEEQTGLPYASRVRAKDDAGQEVPVMHACGHDVHMTSLIGTARVLAATKNQWSGTLVLIGQPAEEKIDGARAMLQDGLYSRFPKPDYALALHDFSEAEVPAGKIGYVSGFMMASSTSVDVTFRGIGGHGAYPEKSKDPIVMAAQYIVAIQTIVSRENSPLDPAVVTVGSIHGGTKRNIIPNEVELQLTVRAYREETRQRILASLDRIAKGVALAAGMPEDRGPIVKVSDTEVAPATYNNPELTTRAVAAMKKALGDESVVAVERMMGSEDFSQFSLDGKIPILMFRVGAIDAERAAKIKASGMPLPSVHSSLFWPTPEPTLRAGITAMTAAVLDLLHK